jgi:DNA-binding response OmpR family regulator
MAKVLIVEDNRDLANMVRTFLMFEHHVVETIENGLEAHQHLRTYPYDLIILDLNLPGMDGLEICREFRAHGGVTPILMLTSKDAVTDKERGLDTGADDYLTKPFHLKELAARVRALLRRPAGVTENILRAGNLSLDPSKYRLLQDDKPVDLLPKEFALLEFLMRHPNQVFSPEALLERVWQTDSEATSEAVRTTMKRLRKKIDTESSPQLIRTIHGVGYILENK